VILDYFELYGKLFIMHAVVSVLALIWLPLCQRMNFEVVVLKTIVVLRFFMLIFGHLIQGLKRLKKLQHEGRYGQTTSSEYCRADESNHGSTSSNSDYKEAPECASKDRVARGSTIPFSIKFKKLTSKEEMGRQREHHRLDRFQHELGKTTREPPPIEIGPKRLKVRGPSSLGSESRLD